MISRAHGVSSAAPAGLQTKMRLREGVSPPPVALNGPEMVIVPRCGWYSR